MPAPDSAITQYFYNADAYEHFVARRARWASRCRSCRASCRSPASAKLARFSDACGAEIPRWMRRKFESFGDDADSIRAFGLDVVTELCQRLIERGAPGLHFYSHEPGRLHSGPDQGIAFHHQHRAEYFRLVGGRLRPREPDRLHCWRLGILGQRQFNPEYGAPP
jgi:hypothetical protein